MADGGGELDGARGCGRGHASDPGARRAARPRQTGVASRFEFLQQREITDLGKKQLDPVGENNYLDEVKFNLDREGANLSGEELDPGRKSQRFTQV
jgi:hypothetical protein